MRRSNYSGGGRKYGSNLEKLDRVEELDSRGELTREEQAEYFILYGELGFSLSQNISPDYSLEELEEVLTLLDAHEAEDYETLRSELNHLQ